MAAGRQIFAKTARYKNRHVVIKKVAHSINVKPTLLKEIKRMRDLQNDHVVQLVGVCTDPGYESILTEYCPKGSLEDVLEDENLDLDLMFKLSLIQDLVRGMNYLHNSEIHYHGNLKTSNCVVDGRFVLKVTDFGLQTLRRRENESDNISDRNSYYKAKLWTAPELLRQHKEVYKDGLQKADVYSFGIISQEILYRKGPFWLEDELDITPEEIVTRIKDGKVTRPSLPCSLDAKTFPTKLLNMIKTCWSENSSTRPDFQNLLRTVNSINKEAGCSGNLMDNLLTRMENYARNLEDLVKERTAGYLEQKKRAEDLLYRMLPESVAEQLMRGQKVEAEKFDSVTIYFSDICGFTKLSSDSTPIQVVDLLNDLYTTFDAIVDNLDVYKVETIGDAYMVVSGLPNRNGMDHARQISRMSLQLLNAVKSFKIRHKPDQQLLLRIGLHSGPVCAGVVGRKMPRYCLFGDTVNTASRMESNGEALKIHVSPYTKEILDTFGTFVMTVNKVIEPKGKQPMLTWWLLGENHPDFPDLAPIDNTTVIPSSQPVENRESAC